MSAAALLGGLLLAPTPGSADPVDPGAPASPRSQGGRLSINRVESRLATLNRQADAATETYNASRVEMHQAVARMKGLQADLDRQRTRVADLRDDIVGAALTDYNSSGGLSTSASFLVAKRPSEFIGALATTAVVEHQQAGLLTQFTQQQNQLGVQEQQAARELTAIAADKREIAGQKAAVEAKIKAASSLLHNLKQKARQRVLARQRAAEAAAAAAAAPPSRDVIRPPTGGVTAPAPPQQNAPATPPASPPATPPASPPATPPASPPAAPPASGRAAIAVQTALAQLGKPYVYGAAGPSSFDCSGLTMYAWAAAGVSLSHASSVQSGQGVAVSISALQPGDLVFYYSPVSHVAMYIGNGQVIHAPHPGSSVEIVPLYSMPISWARRVG